jgi:hypothetical protein
MRKSHSFDELSKSVSCKICGKPIKQRLVESKEKTPRLCYKHFSEAETARNHPMKGG